MICDVCHSPKDRQHLSFNIGIGEAGGWECNECFVLAVNNYGRRRVMKPLTGVVNISKLTASEQRALAHDGFDFSSYPG